MFYNINEITYILIYNFKRLFKTNGEPPCNIFGIACQKSG